MQPMLHFGRQGGEQITLGEPGKGMQIMDGWELPQGTIQNTLKLTAPTYPGVLEC